MVIETFIRDGLVLSRESELDEHEGHNWEASERLSDNPVEFTVWGRCWTCNNHLKIESVSIEGPEVDEPDDEYWEAQP